jgi:hypothetical protein
MTARVAVLALLLGACSREPEDIKRLYMDRYIVWERTSVKDVKIFAQTYRLYGNPEDPCGKVVIAYGYDGEDSAKWVPIDGRVCCDRVSRGCELQKLGFR